MPHLSEVTCAICSALSHSSTTITSCCAAQVTPRALPMPNVRDGNAKSSVYIPQY